MNNEFDNLTMYFRNTVSTTDKEGTTYESKVAVKSSPDIEFIPYSHAVSDNSFVVFNIVTTGLAR